MNTFTDPSGDALNPRRRPVLFMAQESRVTEWRPHNGSLESAHHCRYCGGVLDGLGYHYTCHFCGARYCFIHMRKHDRAHQETSLEAYAR